MRSNWNRLCIKQKKKNIGTSGIRCYACFGVLDILVLTCSVVEDNRAFFAYGFWIFAFFFFLIRYCFTADDADWRTCSYYYIWYGWQSTYKSTVITLRIVRYNYKKKIYKPIIVGPIRILARLQTAFISRIRSIGFLHSVTSEYRILSVAKISSVISKVVNFVFFWGRIECIYVDYIYIKTAYLCWTLEIQER